MDKGFTLIELIISIFVLSIAIVGVFGAFSMIVILTSSTVDRLNAAYLAQEGAEIVRNIRDNNWLKMDVESAHSWLDGLTADNGIDCTEGCEMDYTTGTAMPGATAITPYSARPLNLTDGFYGYGNGTPTKFKRKIKIEPVSSTNYVIKATSEVSWDSKATVLSGAVVAGNCTPSNCITVEAILYNWYAY